MNWQVALPEIALSVMGMLILIFGVLCKTEQARTATMMSVGALLITGFLVLTRNNGVGFNGQFTVDAFAKLIKALVLVGSALTLIVSINSNRLQGIGRFEFPGPDPVRDRRHDGDGVGVEPHHALSVAGAAVAGAPMCSPPSRATTCDRRKPG